MTGGSNAARRMTVGEGIVEHLLAEGVDTVFGIPGAHMYDLNDAMARAGGKLRFVTARHEQGAAWMAYGYAQATGKPGVFTVVPGPGVLNAGAALCTAYAANAPVLCLTGNVMSHLIGQGRGQLHELPDQLGTLAGITRHAARIDHPAEVSSVMHGAFHAMKNGRGGPAAVEAPWDVFGKAGMVDAPRVADRQTPAIDPEALAEAAAMVAGAKRPLIMVGGGAMNAGAEIAALAEKIGAPVTCHRSGKGVIPADHPMAMDSIAAYEYWRECDLLIGIGSRLEMQFMRWSWKPAGLKMLRIDMDPTEFVRLRPDLGLLADAAEGAAALAGACGQAEDRSAEVAALVKDSQAKAGTVQPQADWLDAIRAALPRDGILVEEICQAGFAARFRWPAYTPRSYISCGYQETLGFGYGTALGAKAGRPDLPVVSINGDGGFMFAVQELATAVHEGLNVVAVVFDNGQYGNVRRDQDMRYEGRRIGSELGNPDFVAMAKAFGVHAEEADAAGLEEAVARCIAMERPCLIRVQGGDEGSPWPFTMPAPHS
ncbi:thiamine pyrophosphate-dependent enzyme [Rhodovulum sp. DZ06]|uniref:thiamine pyrophosphate-dependent enzyme n=1 Tax=Rhodovulum sp. DZ06 TaxID=3425126 RepID=UPI003D349A7A